MADIISRAKRSAVMAQISGKNTEPELLVRRMLFKSGYRYRLHAKHLPGKPDIVFSRKRKVIFVHGCFWHRHSGCRFAYKPKSNVEFWETKIQGNVQRDARQLNSLQTLGWSPIIVWGCEVAGDRNLFARLVEFLGPP